MTNETFSPSLTTSVWDRATWSRRRTEARYHCGPATPGRLELEGEAEAIPVWLLDVSTHGVGLLIERPVELGRAVVVHLKKADRTYAFSLPARTIYCVSLCQNDWRLGCELNEPLADDDLDMLLELPPA